MSILNLQYNGVPIAAIGLASLTAGIIAYATFSSEISDAASNVSTAISDAKTAVEIGATNAIDTTTTALNDAKETVEEQASNITSNLGVSSLAQSILPANEEKPAASITGEGKISGGGKRKKRRTPRKKTNRRTSKGRSAK